MDIIKLLALSCVEWAYAQIKEHESIQLLEAQQQFDKQSEVHNQML
jgi:hypothetical protein